MSGSGDVQQTGGSTVALKQKIGLLNGVTLIVGNIIGSGIFISPKGIQQNCGSVGVSLIMWLVCGIFSTIGALCYAELGTTITTSGASYAYILVAFGKVAAFVRIWASVLIIEPAVQASQAVTMANYLIKPFFMDCEAPFAAARMVAALAVLFITIMNCYSVRYGTRIQDYFAYAKVIALIVIIVTGFAKLFMGEASISFDNPWQDTDYNVSNWALALYSGLYAFAGWDTLNFMTEEIVEPYKNLPRAIFISMPVCTVIYLLTSVSYYAVLSPEEVLQSDAVAVSFAGKTLGIFSWVIPVAVAASCFGGLNASIMMSSRLFYVGAREGQLPGYFAMISILHATPAPSIILSGVLTLTFLLVEDVYTLINYFSFCYWLFVALSIFGMLLLRYKKPEMPRPLKFNLFYPVVFSICCIFLVITPLISDTISSLIGIGVVLSGFPVYYLFLYRRPWSCFLSMSNKLTKCAQLLFPVAISSTFQE